VDREEREKDKQEAGRILAWAGASNVKPVTLLREEEIWFIRKGRRGRSSWG
jgi:hypothetical protein